MDNKISRIKLTYIFFHSFIFFTVNSCWVRNLGHVAWKTSARCQLVAIIELVDNVQEFVRQRIYVADNQIKFPVVTTKNPFIFSIIFLVRACAWLFSSGIFRQKWSNWPMRVRHDYVVSNTKTIRHFNKWSHQYLYHTHQNKLKTKGLQAHKTKWKDEESKGLE